MCIYVSVFVYAHMCAHGIQKRVSSSEAGVTGGLELPPVGVMEFRPSTRTVYTLNH